MVIKKVGLWTCCLAICLAALVWRTPTSASADSSINVCGVVSAYAPAGTVTPGSITINGVTFPIAPGASLGNANLITGGANLCLSATLNPAGLITGGTMSPNVVTTTVNVCGVVTAASGSSITIGGQTFPIAPGTTVNGLGLLTPGVNACLSGTLNASGQLIAPSSVSIQPGVNVNVCGTVTAISGSSITIGGQTFPIFPGTFIGGIDQIQSGANACLSATLNASGQIIAPSSITLQPNTTLNVCGVVTAISDSSIIINGQTIPIAPGTILNGAAQVTPGANACLSATLNALGQIVAPSSISVQAGTTVNVCGVVTAISGSSITINGQTFPIFPGTVIGGANQIGSGTNACLNATLNANGQIIAPSSIAVVSTTTTANVCGVVSAISGTSITINGQTFPIAPGVTVNGANQINAGANACLSATLNASGQIVAPSSITLQGSTTVNICGVVSAFTAATASAPGSITIGGQTFPIAAGTVINGVGQLTAGTNACLSGTLNASGQIVAPSSITLQAGTTVNICGVVSAFTAATASAPGSITIGGQTFPIAAGTVINGVGQITGGVNACLSATLNASGQIIVPSSITLTANSTINVCGVVTAFTAATASAPGSITIGGTTIPIAAGTNINGSGLITVGANLCLSATVNANGQIVPPSSVTANAGATVSLCGTVTAFTAATANAPGSITIGGQTIPIAAGTVLGGSGQIIIGSNLCLSATLNGAGQIVGPSSVTVNVNATTTLCGVVTAFTAATASAPGSISIGGVTIPIAPGTVLSGTGLITVGTNLCLNVTLNSSGQINASTSIIGGTCTSAGLCGKVTAFTAATASVPGSITIAGTTLQIAAGVNLTGQGSLSVGVNACLNATVNALDQIILPSSVIVTGGTSANLCGLVTAFTAATATLPGSVTVGGTTLTILPNTALSGQAALNLGANVCLSANLNASGQVTGSGSVVINPCAAATEICGVVSAFTPATAAATGSITIGDTTLTIAIGVTLNGQNLIAVGSTICLIPVFAGPSGGGQQLGPGSTVSTGGVSCPQLQFTVPLVTHGFIKSSFLPDGDLFLLQQLLTMTVVSPSTNGVEIFNVNAATFGGSPVEVGGFPGTNLQGLALTAAGATVRAVACTDSLRKIDFEVASTSGGVGDTVRLFLQNANGDNGQDLALLTVEAGGLRLTSLNANAALFRNNRLAVGAGQLFAGALIERSITAGSAGFRTELLTLALSKAAASPLNGCNQLGVDITRSGGSGKTSIVFTDVVVDRVEVTGDRTRPQLGLLAGVGGGYPTGTSCAIVCPSCSLTAQASTVSAASFERAALASEAIVAAFGSGLATATQSATTLPLPTSLAGTRVLVKDSVGVERLAPLFFVSSLQVNYLIPAGTVTGNATMTITSGSGAVSIGTAQIAAVAPGLFAANANGQGVAAAIALRVRGDASQSFESVAQFDASQGKMVSVPIDLGPNSDQVFLILFGTGLRFRSNLAAVSARVGGADAQVLFAGAQGGFAGLDQVNLLIPRSLVGRGEVDVALTVDGKVANTVKVNIK